MGLLDGGGGGVDERIAEIVIKVFDKYDMEPGEIHRMMKETTELVQELAPVINEMGDLAGDLDNDVSELRGDIENMEDITEDFNENSDELTHQLERTADAFEDFNELIRDAAEQKEDKD